MMFTATTTATTSARRKEITGKLTIKGSYSDASFLEFPEGKMYLTTSHISSEATLTRLIAESARTAVYETTFDGNDVVMKSRLDQERQDALMREAVLYREKLRDLQGTGIPMFYGYYFWAAERRFL